MLPRTHGDVSATNRVSPRHTCGFFLLASPPPSTASPAHIAKRGGELDRLVTVEQVGQPRGNGTQGLARIPQVEASATGKPAHREVVEGLVGRVRPLRGELDGEEACRIGGIGGELDDVCRDLANSDLVLDVRVLAREEPRRVGMIGPAARRELGSAAVDAHVELARTHAKPKLEVVKRGQGVTKLIARCRTKRLEGQARHATREEHDGEARRKAPAALAADGKHEPREHGGDCEEDEGRLDAKRENKRHERAPRGCGAHLCSPQRSTPDRAAPTRRGRSRATTAAGRPCTSIRQTRGEAHT